MTTPPPAEPPPGHGAGDSDRADPPPFTSPPSAPSDYRDADSPTAPMPTGDAPGPPASPYAPPPAGSAGQPAPYGQPPAPYGQAPSYGQAPPYGQPPPGYPPPYAYRRPTNTMAILALVLALVFPPVGIVLGHMARRQIRESGEEGDGLALAGLILGYAVTAFFVVAFCLPFAMIMAMAGLAGL